MKGPITLSVNTMVGVEVAKSFVVEEVKDRTVSFTVLLMIWERREGGSKIGSKQTRVRCS